MGAEPTAYGVDGKIINGVCPVCKRTRLDDVDAHMDAEHDIEPWPVT